ncbi:MAG: SDR family NAD(P)-dependent oxidoreductase [Actinomycetota bacterium]
MRCSPLLSSALDRALETTIVGSFTTVGYRARQAADEWTAIDDLPPLDGKAVLVTGGSSGIGRATVEGLLRLGAEVHLTSRTKARAEDVAAEMNGLGHRGTAIGHPLETADPASIRALADELAEVELEVVVHNAGALTAEYRTTDDGIEATLASHLVGPYLLTMLLRPRLTTGARVLFMSSGGMYTQKLDVDTIEMTAGDYKGAVAYARAKRGQVELVRHLAPLWAPQVILHAVHPGWVDTPGVDDALPVFGTVLGPALRRPEEGADTVIWLAATGGDGAKPGRFWLDRRPRGTVYVPGTGAGDAERRRLVAWLDERIATLTTA